MANNPKKPKQNKSFEIEQHFSKAKAQKFAKLEQRNPPTNIRRFSKKVVYEITMPEVKSIEDISIVQLENSIEIKAIGKNKSYLKSIPITLPLINKDFYKGTLTLELDAQDN